MKKEIRICGFGGQGVILAGVVLGEAATRAGHWAVQTQSYGPESRGGAARAEVLISSEPIDFPRVTRADVIVALSQAGYDKYSADVAEGGVVLVDADLVKTSATGGGRCVADGALAVPFTKTAEEAGHKIVTNMVMLGYLGALLDIVPAELLEETILANIPKGTEKLNTKAVRAGRELYRRAVSY